MVNKGEVLGQRFEPQSPRALTLLSGLSTAHDAPNRTDAERLQRRSLRANVALDALREEKGRLLPPGVHVVVSRPPEALENYSVYVVYPNPQGPRDNFIQVTREMFRKYTYGSHIDHLASEARDVREETLWEKQKRLLMGITELDQMRKPIDDNLRNFVEQEKNRKVLSYLEASIALNNQFRRLQPLYEFDYAEDILIMGQPRERNLPQRLRNTSVAPDLRNADVAHSTRLDIAELERGSDRYISGSEDPDDKVGYDICHILHIGPSDNSGSVS